MQPVIPIFEQFVLLVKCLGWRHTESGTKDKQIRSSRTNSWLAKACQSINTLICSHSDFCQIALIEPRSCRFIFMSIKKYCNARNLSIGFRLFLGMKRVSLRTENYSIDISFYKLNKVKFINIVQHYKEMNFLYGK